MSTVQSPVWLGAQRATLETSVATPSGRTPSVVAAVFAAQWREIARNRWVLAYAIVLLLLTEALFQMGGSGVRALTSLLNLVLLLVPLVTSVFGVVYWYAAREFTELLLAQPVARRRLWWGLYLGLVVPLVAAFSVGLTLPLVWHRALDAETVRLLALYLGVGAALTASFGAAALWIGVRQDDRLRGLGLMLGLWFSAALAYDGVVVWLATAFSDWPLERPMLFAMLANPVDLARTALVLRLDSAALMGYTGAVMARTLGGGPGLAVSALGLALWIAGPVWLAVRAFRRKDF
ncbi:MAG: ABC transporter permease [Gemmatimonadaceae bacterium]|jgi:Cu-processing system permease protein|nr:ABC transporter permease [Gemmatimonadaceae bacterium]